MHDRYMIYLRIFKNYSLKPSEIYDQEMLKQDIAKI